MNNTLIVTGKGIVIGTTLANLTTGYRFGLRSDWKSESRGILAPRYTARFQNVTADDINYIKLHVGERAKYQLI